MSQTKPSLTKEEVLQIAKLAMIELTEEEIEIYRVQLSSILEYVRKLDEVNTDAVDSKSHTSLKNVLRDDEIKDSLTQKDALLNRPKKQSYGYITVKSKTSSDD